MHYDNEKAFGRYTLYASVCQKRLADGEKQSGQRAGCNGAVITDNQSIGKEWLQAEWKSGHGSPKENMRQASDSRRAEGLPLCIK